MQDSGYGNPPLQDGIETIPLHLGALTATDQNAPPQPANTTHEDTQLTGITGNGMILVERKIDAVPAPLQCLSLSNLAFSSRMMTPTASRSDSNCFVSCPLMNTTTFMSPMERGATMPCPGQVPS